MYSYCNLFTSSSSHFMIGIIILILIQVPLSLCQENHQYETCRESFRCLDIENISYPFYGRNRPDYCGHPGFLLTNCDGEYGNFLAIEINSFLYSVLAIDKNVSSLTVRREDLLYNLCSSGSEFGDTRLNFTLFDYGPDERNLTLYYDCPTGPTLHRLPCRMNSERANYFMPDIPDEGNMEGCKREIKVPINQTSYQILTNPSASIDDLKAALAAGFGLNYLEGDTNCSRCLGSGGLCGHNWPTDSFTCHCKEGSYPLDCSDAQRKGYNSRRRRQNMKKYIVIGVFVVLAVIMAAVLLVCLCKHQFFKKENQDDNIEAYVKNCGTLNTIKYSYADVKKMTNTFTEKLGQGGYGSVYKGKLSDGHLVAVKILSEAKGDGEEFINEIASISRTSHVNIVTLLGFCDEGKKRALIYEFMPNGSLDKYICTDGSLNTNCLLEWEKLYQISVGVARGLEYLHRGCSTRIVHFDIKPQNILLDEDFCPKIADFGLAKLCLKKESIISMLCARGTIGYIAPEVFCRNFGGASHKSDVYSFGMMLLEMAGTKKKIKFEDVQTSEVYFPDCIYEHLRKSEELMRNGMVTEEEEETARKMILVGLWCIQTNPSDRPSMSNIIEMLERSIQSLEIPPKPFLFSSTSRSSPEKSINYIADTMLSSEHSCINQ